MRLQQPVERKRELVRWRRRSPAGSQRHAGRSHIPQQDRSDLLHAMLLIMYRHKG